MQSGGIGIITTNDSASTIDTTPFPLTESEGDHELLSTVEAEWTQEAFNGTTLNKGRAAKETAEEIKTTRLTDDGKIEAGKEKTDVATHITDFLRVPGEFIVTESTRDEFAHELLKEATGETIHPAAVDLGGFAEANPEAEPWMGWFRGDGGPLNAGFASGEINSAPDMADYLRKNQNTQLGLQGVEFNGRKLKLVVSRSGWIAIYEPKEMDSIEFAQFIREKVQPFAAPNI